MLLAPSGYGGRWLDPREGWGCADARSTRGVVGVGGCPCSLSTSSSMIVSFTVANGGWRWVGVRDHGKCLDHDIRGHRFLLGGVLLTPLLMSS
ncbi:hypothetical protein BDA96_04G167600 [Sorghum bicolor]|uniref:Uncharacterized protein n=2 Tax=Sorghum bicolor TaxID=4558 RepID=A0A921R501_SORBI|nr:hypothetical protein BDA96_04G167600 [Sorghum bicolor]KXG30285.1 hypothetical protein SORBI_3004G157200 [Sorghum bicolor]